MRANFKAILFFLCFLLLSGSVISLPPEGKARSLAPDPEQIESLLQQAEQDLQAFKSGLWAEAEKFVAEQRAQMKRAREQKLFTEAGKLQEQFQAEASIRQSELEKEALNLQLQLIFVSLEPEQQKEKVKQLQALTAQIEKEKDHISQVYEEQIRQLQAEQEQSLQLSFAQLEQQVEQVLQEELLEYAREQELKLKQALISLPTDR